MPVSALSINTAADLHLLDSLLVELELELDPKPQQSNATLNHNRLQVMDDLEVIDFYALEDGPKETNTRSTPQQTLLKAHTARSHAVERLELGDSSISLSNLDLATLRAQAGFAESLRNKELLDLMHALDIDQQTSDSLTEDDWTYSATSENIDSDISSPIQISESAPIMLATHIVPTKPLKLPKSTDDNPSEESQPKDTENHTFSLGGRLHENSVRYRKLSRRSRSSQRQLREIDHEDDTRLRRRIEPPKRPSKKVKTDMKLDTEPVPQIAARIFIEDARQSVEITLPRDARTLETIAKVRHAASCAQIAVTMDASADWTLFEILPAYGLERAVRHYEVLSTILETWDPITDKDNALLVKRYAYLESLRLQDIPRSMLKQELLVRHNVKKSKWVKSCLELKEHGVFTSKKAHAKDSEYLCSMSNYDVYTVNARPDGSPTAFVMALKAQDPIRLFEDPDNDFMHWFAVESAEQLRHAVLTFRAARSFIVGTKALIDLEKLAKSDNMELVERPKSASLIPSGEQRIRRAKSQAALPKQPDKRQLPPKRSPSAHVGQCPPEIPKDDKDPPTTRSNSSKGKKTLLDRIYTKEAAELVTGRRMDLAVAESFMGEAVPLRGRSQRKANLNLQPKSRGTLVDLNEPELYAEGSLLAKGGAYAQKKVEAVLQKCGELEAKDRPGIYTKTDGRRRRNL